MSNRPGRNDPCPCGSGKKYKRCCLQADEAAARERAQQALFDDDVFGDSEFGANDEDEGFIDVDEDVPIIDVRALTRVCYTRGLVRKLSDLESGRGCGSPSGKRHGFRRRSSIVSSGKPWICLKVSGVIRRSGIRYVQCLEGVPPSRWPVRVVRRRHDTSERAETPHPLRTGSRHHHWRRATAGAGSSNCPAPARVLVGFRDQGGRRELAPDGSLRLCG
jgi:hypothetical protein